MKKTKISPDSSPVFKMFQENETILKRFLRRFMSNFHDVEDICQETILRALEAEKSREINEPRAFLFGVTKNIVRKKLDKESRTVIDFIEDFTPQEYLAEEPGVEETIDSRRQMQIFTAAVATLPQQCQRVFVMKKVYGYSHKEIAKQLGISISTVEKHVATGLKRCGDYMDKKQGQSGRGDGVSSDRMDTQGRTGKGSGQA
jgi:RNA polymerase sigma factor (sigma-70 family)